MNSRLSTGPQPKVSYLLCDGRSYTTSTSENYIWLYLQLEKAGLKPKMYDRSGVEITVKVGSNPIYYLGCVRTL